MLELGRLKQYLYEIDPDAFMAVNDTAEVIGKKFLSWEDEGFKPIRKNLSPGPGVLNPKMKSNIRLTGLSAASKMLPVPFPVIP